MAKRDKGVITGAPKTRKIPLPAGGVALETFIPWTLVKRGVRREIITPIDTPEAFKEEASKAQEKAKAEALTPLIRALGLAHYWRQLMDEKDGGTMTDIAKKEGMALSQVSRIAQLVFLAPDLIETILQGGAPRLTLEFLVRRPLPSEWDKQRKLVNNL